MKMSNTLTLVAPGLHGGVLAVLARTEKPLTGRAVALLVQPRASLSGVQKVLADLVRNGLLRTEPAGRAKLYTLNREHVAYPAVHTLVHLREELLTRIRAEAAAWELPAVALWMFGSAARGEAGPESDIDLLVVRHGDGDDADPSWLQQIDMLSMHVTAWTGNGCEILEMSEAELGAAIQRDDRLIAEVRRDAIHLAGARPRSALRRRVTR